MPQADEDDLLAPIVLSAAPSVNTTMSAPSSSTVTFAGAVQASQAEEAGKRKKAKPVMSPDSVYSANKSVSGYNANNIAFPLSYGSADLQGFKFIDTVCLNPLLYHSMDEVTDKVLRENFCARDFKYQAVM